MKFILATKEQMTQYFTADGKCVAATILKAGPVTVTQVKTTAKDGYVALQLGYGDRSLKNINKAQQGAWGELGSFRFIREYRPEDGILPDVTVGSTFDASAFAPGDNIEVAGTSKGKGFQGVIKRHGFKGQPRSHGQKHSERDPGSIGGGGRAGGRVAKGMRMAGRMGGDRVTVKNLRILAVDKTNNTILISGAIPGRRGTLIEIHG